MIPKVVHYCWFGKAKYPDKVNRCIESWKRVLFDYSFMLWNEDSFDITSVEFVKESYNDKKYAFVSDYVRLFALNKYGGIYLDTDIEMIKSIDDLLVNSIVLGTDEKGFLTAFMASEKNQDLWKNVMKSYESMKYIRNKNDNFYVNNKYIQEELKKYGYIIKNVKQSLTTNIMVYPNEYFHAKNLTTGKLYITNNTRCIHHHTLLWVKLRTKIIKKIRISLLVPLIGESAYNKLINRIKKYEKRNK